MALQIKIHGATPKSTKTLCITCKNASIIKGQNCEEMVKCGSNLFEGFVPFRIAECSQYHPSNMPWLHEMEQMAWKIEARRRGPVGFEKTDDGQMEIVIVKPRDYSSDPEIS